MFLGLVPFLNDPVVFKLIAYAGGEFMIFMYVGMFREIKTLSLETAGESPVRGNIILLGAGLSLANPCWIIWWATIGLGYILSAGRIYRILIGVCAGFLLSYALYLIGSSLFIKLLQREYICS